MRAELRMRGFSVALLVCLLVGPSTASDAACASTFDTGWHNGCVVTAGGGAQFWGTHSQALNIPDGYGVVGCASGYASNTKCVLFDSGEVWCWAIAFDISHLSSGSSFRIDTAGALAESIDCDQTICCALLNSGNVQCWADAIAPFTTPGGANVWPHAVEKLSTFRFGFCVVLTDGSASCHFRSATMCGAHVGNTIDLGVDSNSIVSFSSGSYRSLCVLLTGNRVKCWGCGDFGQLGQGSTYSYANGIQAASLPYVSFGVDANGDQLVPVQLSGGEQHHCALFSDSSVKCWGYNNGGQLGHFSGTLYASDPSSAPIVDLGSETNQVQRISVGPYYTCAIVPSGVKCWGNSFSTFQLGMQRSGIVGRYPADRAYLASSAAIVQDLFGNLVANPMRGSCSSEDSECDLECPAFSSCYDGGDGNFSCACWSGFEEDGESCQDIDECQIESLSAMCHHLAFCDNKNGSFSCRCQDGFIGNGLECFGEAWGVRSVFQVGSARRSLSAADLQILKFEYGSRLVGDALGSILNATNGSFIAAMPTSYGNLHYGASLMEVLEEDAQGQVTLIALFRNQSDAQGVLDALAGVDMSTFWADMLPSLTTTILGGPEVYRWVAPTTDAPQEINPTGLQVDRVYFEPSCLQTGCWKVDITYTAGVDNFNVFYIPKTNGSDSLSYDQSYDTITSPWTISPEDTFLPANHPCTSADYEALVDVGLTPASVTVCCIPQFLAMYRPVETFEDAFSSQLMSNITAHCGSGARARGVTRGSIPTIAKSGQDIGGNVFERPIAPVVEGISGDLFPSEEHGIFVQGRFQGLLSHIDSTRVVDSYVGIYEATLTLDEKEVRTLAGMLSGTVGIEHAVDTFVGMAEFSPTGSFVLDPFARQVAIHLEKTSFFTVSTHGTNDYTFLEYVNMRLVAIYNEDTDFSGGDESGSRTVRTSSALQTNYVQVTFTMGAQYAVDPAGSSLIPLDSVRAGHGTFFAGSDLAHLCSDWDDGSFANQTLFNQTLMQNCAPSAAMCVSPASIPDSFVVFNIPLGVDYFAEDAGGASETLANNIFVDMVISATEPGATREDSTAPNSGGDPMQMKTTLTASIPIVDGGINIFCDGYTAKTDLKDVANADIVVGSASTQEELSRLRIKTDIASTQLAPQSITEINSDSIEAGLMTLVLKGNSSYFLSNSGRDEVTLELEDVITLHIMEDDGSGADTTVSGSVSALITAPPDDNTLPSGLDTDGYALNGAFYFTIDRAAQRAHLEPSDDLLDLCPFNPPRPDGSMELETCVMRRDVRYRNYPWRAGAKSTAMEICTAANPGDEITPGSCPSAAGASSDEAKFFVTMLGDNDYAKALANAFAAEISDKYKLNGRYRRAYWINPGYEWTPTQTGGTPLFSVSQKLYLFALITLDEGLTSDAGSSIAGDSPELRRHRMLLQSSNAEKLQDGESTVGAEAFQFETTPTSIMASAFDVPEDRVATFKATLQLTQAEACLSKTELAASVRATLDDYLSEAASATHTVQVTSMSVDRAGVACTRRSRRSLLSGLSEATAEVTMLVVFMEGAEPTISLDKIASMPGVKSIEPLVVSDTVNTAAPTTYVPPPPPADDEASESSSSNTAVIIAAAAGGAVAVVVLAVAAALISRRRPDTPVAAVETIDIENLKAQLSDEQ